MEQFSKCYFSFQTILTWHWHKFTVNIYINIMLSFPLCWGSCSNGGNVNYIWFVLEKLFTITGNSSCHSCCVWINGDNSTSSWTVYRFHSWPLTLLSSPVESLDCATAIHTPACTLWRCQMSSKRLQSKVFWWIIILFHISYSVKTMHQQALVWEVYYGFWHLEFLLSYF